MNRRVGFTLGMLLLAVLACGTQATPAAPPEPTVTEPNTPPPAAEPTQPPAPTATPPPNYDVDTTNCSPNFVYVADVNIPDDTRIDRGETFEKRWIIQNTGSCTWGPEYEIVQLRADENAIVAQPAFIPGIVEPGQQVEIAVTFTLETDAAPGSRVYGVITLRTPDGRFFGQQPYVQVIVGN